jgi:hypothetical protein
MLARYAYPKHMCMFRPGLFKLQPTVCGMVYPRSGLYGISRGAVINYL